jgi:muramoyltetrapeptide carboxypeptidase
MPITDQLKQNIALILKDFLNLKSPIINFQKAQITIPIYLIAPSGYAEDNKLKAALLFFQNFSLNYLVNQQNWQIQFKILENQFQTIANRRYQRFGGSIEERISDFNFQNIPEGSIIMPIRGGYGLSEIMPYLNFSDILDNIQKKKLFVQGYSDFTLFHLASFKYQSTLSNDLGANNSHIPTFLGPMFASDFYHPQPSIYTVLNFLQNYLLYQLNLNQSNHLHLLLQPYQNNYQQNLDDDGCYSNNLNCQPYHNQFNLQINHANPEQVITPHSKTSLQGQLWGGNLCMICHALATPFFPKLNDLKNGILIIEDIAEVPYAIDRMLYQLQYSGVLATQTAVVLGQFSQYKISHYDNGFDLSTVFNKWHDILAKQGVLLLTGLNFGHTYHKQTLAIGQTYNIDLDTPVKSHF